VSPSAPQRTCVACRKKGDQGSFLRISAETLNVIDGPSRGRSAYVCASAGCVDAVFAKGRLGRALKKTVSQQELERLRQLMADRFPKENKA
jgi:predicted RNA-binding protein YlxR (DUF448 family)